MTLTVWQAKGGRGERSKARHGRRTRRPAGGVCQASNAAFSCWSQAVGFPFACCLGVLSFSICRSQHSPPPKYGHHFGGDVFHPPPTDRGGGGAADGTKHSVPILPATKPPVAPGRGCGRSSCQRQRVSSNFSHRPNNSSETTPEAGAVERRKSYPLATFWRRCPCFPAVAERRALLPCTLPHPPLRRPSGRS
jgi:hypothetical protein